VKSYVARYLPLGFTGTEKNTGKTEAISYFSPLTEIFLTNTNTNPNYDPNPIPTQLY